MIDHLHSTYVEGCYRCEISQSEAISEAAIDAINEQVDIIADRADSLRYAKLRHGYALVREDSTP